jgi:predicted transcriptional regulator of viral defense system
MISTAQLLAAGVDRGAIKWRVKRGRLHPYDRGVYSVSPVARTFRAPLWAAVLACGGPEAAVISHRSAAALWELVPTPSGAVDVTTLRESYSANGLRVHRTRTLRPDDMTTLDGLPVTTPTRTLTDLAEVLSPHRLERACHAPKSPASSMPPFSVSGSPNSPAAAPTRCTRRSTP